MERKEAKNRSPLVILAAVLGGGFMLFVLVIVVPAILLLSDGGSSLNESHAGHLHEVTIPADDGTAAPDFFDDLED